MLLNSRETVGSELARVPRELSLGARQDERQGCLQQDILESSSFQTAVKLFASLALLATLLSQKFRGRIKVAQIRIHYTFSFPIFI